MKEFSENGVRFVDCLESILDDQTPTGSKSYRIRVEKINSLVYALNISESKLLVLYYMPGSHRLLDFAKQSSDIQIIHIDEDVWICKPDILLSRIQVLLGNGIKVFARQCVVARIDKKEALRFQEEHHLQIAIPGKYRYGLFYEGDLIAIAVFSGGRNMKHTENYRSFECIRFCSKKQHVVVGGLSKLLKAFILDFSPNDIMTYIDLDWSDGRKFERTGFSKVSILGPQTFWVNKETNQRISVKEYEDLLKGRDDLLSSENIVANKAANHPTEYYQVANLGSIKMVRYL